MELFWTLVFFAFATCITPGPNNIMIMSSGVNCGVQKSLPHLAGIQLGFLLMLLAVGLVAGLILQQQPQLHMLIKLIGSVYLLYLAWKIATAQPRQIRLLCGWVRLCLRRIFCHSVRCNRHCSSGR